MSTSTILSVSRLSAGYDGKKAVADLSFSLKEGEILCLVGESGCGKSTVLKALLSAPEVTLFSGDAVLYDTALSSLSAKERARFCSEKIGMIFQSPGTAFNPIRSYRKQFIETLKSHKKYDAKSFGQDAAAAFGKVELKETERILSSCPYSLSGGMNQRAALALAMLLKQGILFCDEPTSALDATIQLQVAEELKKLRDENAMSMIIVTHNAALACFLADRIGVMYAGRLVELGTAEEVLKAPKHPYTKSLISAIPSLDGRKPEGLPGLPPLSGPAEQGCDFSERCPLASDECTNMHYETADACAHFSTCIRSQKESV